MDNALRDTLDSGIDKGKASSKRNRWLVLGLVFSVFVVLFLVVGCAPKAASPPSSTEEDEDPIVVDVVWSEASDCVSCHLTEAKSSTDSSYGCYVHFQEGESCLSCHTNAGSALVKVHEGYATGKVPTQLTKTKDSMNEALCLTSGCHVKSDNIEATKDSTVLTDLSGRVQNPHDLPVHSDHTNMINCLSCHVMHQPLQLEVSARLVCIGCHHQNEFECFTCHESADGPE
ncbi:MAG: hypothetical protein FWF91_00110 [Coriobacteriia bacterium]|nr:hypothetical protein [Coriobacteriia bacterium]